MPKKIYLVQVSILYDKEVVVTAKNRREAVKKAKAKFIGKPIKRNYFDNDATGVLDEHTEF